MPKNMDNTFAHTCAVSGLPIEAAEPVRFLFLQSSPFSPRGEYASGDLDWYLRAPPIRATYDGYGSIACVNPRDESIQRLWIEGLDLDLYGGWDVSIFSDLCEGLHVGRYEVSRRLNRLSEDHCHLGCAVVREDVWTSILASTLIKYPGKRDGKDELVGGVAAIHAMVLQAWQGYQKLQIDLPRDADLDRNWRSWGRQRDNFVAALLSDNPSVSGFGLDTSWKLFAKHADRAESETSNFLDVVAETLFVEQVIRAVRVAWRPVGPQGPQIAEWPMHVHFHQMIAHCARRRQLECER